VFGAVLNVRSNPPFVTCRVSVVPGDSAGHRMRRCNDSMRTIGLFSFSDEDVTRTAF